MKKIKETAHSRIPDVELANLRNLPRRSNFIQSSNILYNTGPLTDSDIASLPQIKREQLSIDEFLGSGAFGEVYEGIVRNVDESDIKVAIKVSQVLAASSNPVINYFYFYRPFEKVQLIKKRVNFFKKHN